jgi:hypothetical protein
MQVLRHISNIIQVSQRSSTTVYLLTVESLKNNLNLQIGKLVRLLVTEEFLSLFLCVVHLRAVNWLRHTTKNENDNHKHEQNNGSNLNKKVKKKKKNREKKRGKKRGKNREKEGNLEIKSLQQCPVRNESYMSSVPFGVSLETAPTMASCQWSCVSWVTSTANF